MQYFIYGISNCVTEQMIKNSQIQSAKSSYISTTNSVQSNFTQQSSQQQKYDYMPQYFYPLTHQSLQNRILRNDGYMLTPKNQQQSNQNKNNNQQFSTQVDNETTNIKQFVNEENMKNQQSLLYIPYLKKENSQKENYFSFASPDTNNNINSNNNNIYNNKQDDVIDTTLQDISTKENSKNKDLSNSELKIQNQVQNFLEDKKILKCNLGINKNCQIEKLSRDVYLQQPEINNNNIFKIENNNNMNQDFQNEKENQQQQSFENYHNINKNNQQQQQQQQISEDPLGIFECTNTEEDEQYVYNETNYNNSNNNNEFGEYNYQNQNSNNSKQQMSFAQYKEQLQEIQKDIFQKTQESRSNSYRNSQFQQQQQEQQIEYQQNSPIQQKFSRENQDIVFNNDIFVNIEGEYMYEGQYEDQSQLIKKGFGILKCMETDIEIYKGDWDNNKFHGQGCQINKKYNFNDSFQWLQNLDFNQQIELFTCEKDSKWYSYEGEFENGVFSGFGCLYFNDSKGDRLVGNFVQGNISGQATLYLNNQIKVTGEWSNNKIIEQF